MATVDASKRQMDLWPVYRLYPDIYRTFMFGMYRPFYGPIPIDQEEIYKEFRGVDQNGDKYIPVPSRLYSRPYDNGIRGQRIAVKGE